MFLNTGSGGIHICEVESTFELLNVRGNKHSFLTHEPVFVWNCQRFWERKCLDLKGTRRPSLQIHANALTICAIRARHLLSHIFKYGLWRYRYFLSKVNIWNVNCVWATAFFSTHESMFLWKCQSFRERKYLDMRGARTFNLRIHAEWERYHI